MGEAGPAHFFETTTGWGPVLDDRNDPLYPRAQTLAAQTRITVDAALGTLSVPVQPAHRAGLLVEALRTSVSTTGTTQRSVVPTFGREPRYSTNPIAFAAPGAQSNGFSLDMATSRCWCVRGG